jgi:hypothetical protein
MQSEELGKYLSALKKGDKISLILAGIIVDGTFEELADGNVVLSDATSPSVKKKRYSLKIPTENIYAWGKKEKRGKRAVKAQS